MPIVAGAVVVQGAVATVPPLALVAIRVKVFGMATV